MSKFADFIRNASLVRRQEVFARVIDRACERQVMAISAEKSKACAARGRAAIIKAAYEEYEGI